MSYLDSNGVVTLASAIKQEMMNTPFTGATDSANGAAGVVPAPDSTWPNYRVLAANGAWKYPMVSKTTTNADGVVTEFLNNSLSSSKTTATHVIRKKLWENASPSSTFAAQTIELSEDVENYLFWVIECRIINTGDEMVSFMFVGRNAGRLTATAVTTNSNKGIARSMSIDSTGTQLTFGAGYYNNDVTAGRMVPFKVFGFYKMS